MSWNFLKTDAGKKHYTIEAKVLPTLPDASGQPLPRPRWLRQLSLTFWLWELLSLLTSATCIGAIVVLLACYDNKPMPSWSYGLTMNGVISVLAVIAKAAMVLPIAEALSQMKWYWFWYRPRPVMDFETFDNASRGPWGSLTMLLHVRLWSVGAIGAALTLAAMVVEPSLQQIPSYPSLSSRAGSASLGRCGDYTDHQPAPAAEGIILSQGVKSATYLGIFGSADSVSYVPTCQTGNCTWPTFSTLAVCSACADLSSQLVQVPTAELGTRWVVMNTTAAWMDGFAGTRTESLLVWGPPSHSSLAFQPVANHTIFDLDFLYWPVDSVNTDPPSGAFECIVYFCVQTMSASTSNGVYTETVLDTWPPANGSLPNVPEFNLFTDMNVTDFNLTATEQKENFTLRPPDSGETYKVDRATLDLLRIWTKPWGELISSDRYASTSASFDIDDVAGVFYGDMSSTLGPNQTIGNHSVPTTAGPGRMMAQIATSLTTYLRKDKAHSLPVVGDATYARTFVRARWQWLICPAALLLLTAAFTVSTIMLSAIRRVPVWKSSSLAVLVHGLDEPSSREMSARRLDEMEKHASAYKMSVRQVWGSWRLEGEVAGKSA